MAYNLKHMLLFKNQKLIKFLQIREKINLLLFDNLGRIYYIVLNSSRLKLFLISQK